jgi:hypothetical protein
MVNAWVSGADRAPAGRAGATYRAPGAPWRFVFHKMEAPDDATGGLWGSVEGLKSYIRTHDAPPHLWAAQQFDWVGQSVPLTLSAYALRHPPGTPETNHAHAIQVEVLGYSAEGLQGSLCDWLGRRVLGPVLRAGIPIDLSNLARSTGSDGYGTDGAVRMSWAAWAAFDGVCGHANVPGNSHWDPGRADYARIARMAGGAPIPVPTPEEENEMLIVDPPGGSAFLLHGGKLVGLKSLADLNGLRDNADVKVWKVTDSQWSTLVAAYPVTHSG